MRTSALQAGDRIRVVQVTRPFVARANMSMPGRAQGRPLDGHDLVGLVGTVIGHAHSNPLGDGQHLLAVQVEGELLHLLTSEVEYRA